MYFHVAHDIAIVSGTFCPPVKKGGNVGRMSVDILGVGPGVPVGAGTAAA